MKLASHRFSSPTTDGQSQVGTLRLRRVDLPELVPTGDAEARSWLPKSVAWRHRVNGMSMRETCMASDCFGTDETSPHESATPYRRPAP